MMGRKIRNAMGLFFLGYALIVMAPQAAYANAFIDFFFPTLRKDEHAPTADGRAPFADKNAKPVLPFQEPELHEFKNVIPLDKPHVQTGEVSDWVVMAVAEALTFDKPAAKESFEATAQHFDDNGRKEYQKFLKVERFLDVLKNRRFVIRSFVQEQPLLLNKGIVNGTYHWLYEVKVMLTFMDRTMDDYKKADPITQEAVVKVQVGRIKDAKNDIGLVIDRWSGRVKVDKKRSKR